MSTPESSSKNSRSRLTKAGAVLAGMSLSIAGLTACGPEESAQPNTQPTPVATASYNPSSEASASASASSSESTTTSETGHITTMNISADYLENAIIAMDGFKNGYDTSAQGYIDGIYAAYVPEILGASGMCISQTEAQAEVDARNKLMKMMEELKASVPEELYNQYSYIYWNSKRLEDQSAALFANAAPDAECPDGSNADPVTFEFDGQQHTTNASHVLLYTRGVSELKQYPNIYTQQIIKGRITESDKQKYTSEADFPVYAMAQAQKIEDEGILSLLEHFKLP